MTIISLFPLFMLPLLYIPDNQQNTRQKILTELLIHTNTILLTEY